MSSRHSVVELCGRKFLICPVAAGVLAYRTPTIIRDNEMSRIVRVYPQIVKITVCTIIDRLVRLASVRGPKKRRVLHIHHVLILRIGEDMCVVECSLPYSAVVVDQTPSGPSIV